MDEFWNYDKKKISVCGGFETKAYFLIKKYKKYLQMANDNDVTIVGIVIDEENNKIIFLKGKYIE